MSVIPFYNPSVPAGVTEEGARTLLEICQKCEGALPDWAIGKTDSYLAVGAQLRTRDGRVSGNAVVAEYPCVSGDRVYAKVVTDAGSVMMLTLKEMAGMFYEPEWLMDVQKAPGVAHNNLALAIDPARPGGDIGGWVLMSVDADRRLEIHASGRDELPKWLKEKAT